MDETARRPNIPFIVTERRRGDCLCTDGHPVLHHAAPPLPTDRHHG